MVIMLPIPIGRTAGILFAFALLARGVRENEPRNTSRAASAIAHPPKRRSPMMMMRGTRAYGGRRDRLIAPEAGIMFSHHKSGHILSHKIVARARRLGGDVRHGGHWFGQGLNEGAIASFARRDRYFKYRCHSCFQGALVPTARVVNIVRDPFSVVASGYAYRTRAECEMGKLDELLRS